MQSFGAVSPWHRIGPSAATVDALFLVAPARPTPDEPAAAVRPPNPSLCDAESPPDDTALSLSLYLVFVSLLDASKAVTSAQPPRA
jgi:hypothetical protein